MDNSPTYEVLEKNKTQHWDAIDYTAAQRRHKQWVENTDDRDKKRGRKESALSLDIIEGTQETSSLLEQLEQALEDTYAHFSPDFSQLHSYKRYGQESRDFNRGGDDIDTIIDYLHKGKFPSTKIATVIGDGYPLKWRQQWPTSNISAFDVNPFQHVAWGHTIQSKDGANKGFLVDAGVKEWMREFLQKTQPDILYLSNVVKFIQKTPQQVVDLAEAILEQMPAVIVCTNPVRSTREDGFAELLKDHYTVEFPGAKSGETIPTNLVYIRKNLEKPSQSNQSLLSRIMKRFRDK